MTPNQVTNQFKSYREQAFDELMQEPAATKIGFLFLLLGSFIPCIRKALVEG